ncbi:Alpha/Beta hydrolase protein [Pseudoneurospora amorphoporcata]|uniref:Alpha/Beta hydrolase protein n=1 Tax=Pseudoneurospora amorphoporcata TaxID=241081 RepID=A0AAN6SHM6_9PEZI|nr:Alpha/Beta hydrolase protein [Pseudoneurospora amorphoporcata]
MSFAPDFPPKLTPHDPRVLSKTTTINGKKYHYLISAPPADASSSPEPRGTVLLVHGFPDVSLGWRYQVPFLVSLGLRVIVPDLPGFGGSDSPPELTAYSFKNVSHDLLELVASEVPGGRAQIEKEGGVIVGGHDWGGAVAWRFALWFPGLVKAVFSVCTPFWAPRAGDFVPLEEMVQTVLPNFKYQVQLAGPEVEEKVAGEEKIRQWLSGVYGEKGPDGEVIFTTEKGVLFENLPKMSGKSPLLDEKEMEYYVQQYVGNDGGSMRGSLNWYRTTRVNYDDERELVEQLESRGKSTKTMEKIVEPPSLFVLALKDAALPPAMSKGMERYFDKLTSKEVDASHWALWEQPVKVNLYIGEFLASVLGTEEDAKL